MNNTDKTIIKELNSNYDNRLTSAQIISLKEYFVMIRAEAQSWLIEKADSQWCEALDKNTTIIREQDCVKITLREQNSTPKRNVVDN